MTRYALIPSPGTRWNDARVIAKYLPDNYRVVGEAPWPGGGNAVLIAGEDVAGWTLDEYVLPRLASGLIHGVEVVTPDGGGIYNVVDAWPVSDPARLVHLQRKGEEDIGLALCGAHVRGAYRWDEGSGTRCETCLRLSDVSVVQPS